MFERLGKILKIFFQNFVFNIFYRIIVRTNEPLYFYKYNYCGNLLTL